MKKATKISLVLEIASSTGYRQAICLEVLNQFLEAVVEKVTQGKIEIRGFGQFKTRHRKARVGMNIVARTKIDVPAKIVLIWKPSRELWTAVRQAGELRRNAA